MIKNYFTKDQLELLKSLIGQRLDGFFVDGVLFPFSHIYDLALGTDKQVIRLKTEIAREGVETDEYEEINYWIIDRVSASKDEISFSKKSTWFENEVITNVQIVRSNFTKILGAGIGVIYSVDTAMVFYLETGIITLCMEGIDRFIDVSLKPFEGFEGYEAPKSTGYMVTFDDDKDSHIEHFQIEASLLSLAEAEKDAPNFRRGLNRAHYSFLNTTEIYALHSMLGKTIDNVQKFIKPDLGVQTGLRLESAGYGVEVLSQAKDRWFLEGPWDGQQHFSELVVVSDSLSAEMRKAYTRYVWDSEKTEDLNFPFRGEKLERIEIVDEILDGIFFDQKYRLEAQPSGNDLNRMQPFIDPLKWEYGSCIAIVLHFETGATVIFRPCIHNRQIRTQHFVNEKAFVTSLKARFADLKVEIHSDTRRMYTMSEGPWVGPGEPVDLNWVSDEAMLAKGCTLKCHEQDAATKPVD